MLKNKMKIKKIIKSIKIMDHMIGLLFMISNVILLKKLIFHMLVLVLT